MKLDELRASDRAVITITEAAAVLEVDERTVRRACTDGQIAHVRVGARILVLRQQFVDMLDGRPKTEPADPLQLPPKDVVSLRTA